MSSFLRTVGLAWKKRVHGEPSHLVSTRLRWTRTQLALSRETLDAIDRATEHGSAVAMQRIHFLNYM